MLLRLIPLITPPPTLIATLRRKARCCFVIDIALTTRCCRRHAIFFFFFAIFRYAAMFITPFFIATLFSRRCCYMLTMIAADIFFADAAFDAATPLRLLRYAMSPYLHLFCCIVAIS